ncbi:glutamine synthetase family protein [Kaistia geumhonensis]|uniref:Glutamine synthetase n=1 Tax=Kaistia geumhonensis TaxID=410839 RepID=A0ABU0MB13_9HYPH|nr:glutamine synthetase family protein [Kaistia geumhonensis]MCX5481110.1 glutamine synthetase family protein [Kaistia geumhonensis]MDQ0518170.1 glutamine synthetase [Kaistia geumhonensis]
MTGTMTLKELEAAIDAGTIDTVIVAFPDMQGRLVGKRFTGAFFLDSAIHETHACNYLLTVDIDMEPVPGYQAASWEKGYGDFVLKPDITTLRRIPWLEGTALMLADVCDHHGEDLPHSPRAMLKAQLKRLADRGMSAFFASELEFYVFDETFESASGKRWRDLKTMGNYIEDYHILQTTKNEPLLRAIRNGLMGAGIPIENSKGEWGPGQEEVNIRYAEALTMADWHVVMKNGIKEIAHLQNRSVTFMAKWRYDLAGSSSHIHSSLWDHKAKKPLFMDEKDPLGMSATMKSWLAGHLTLAPDFTYFLAPYINSYKRFQVGTFAPTKAVWSVDNRTAGFRVVGEGKSVRTECRIGGADLNPYLAFSALIAAGLHGMDEKLALEAAFSGDAYGASGVREVPKTLRDAIVALDGSAVMRAALGDGVVDHYLHTGRWEQFEYDRRVTDWELQRGFERY